MFDRVRLAAKKKETSSKGKRMLDFNNILSVTPKTANPPYEPNPASRFLICLGPTEELMSGKLELCTGPWNKEATKSALAGLTRSVTNFLGTPKGFDDVIFRVRFELLWGSHGADSVRQSFLVGSGWSNDFVKVIRGTVLRKMQSQPVRC
jgi:hypothetical protein